MGGQAGGGPLGRRAAHVAHFQELPQQQNRHADDDIAAAADQRHAERDLGRHTEHGAEARVAGLLYAGVDRHQKGDGGGSAADFGANTTLEAQTALTSTSSSAPSCVKEGFTGETNNLKLAATPALGSESSPTMASEQTNGTSGTASCATAA